MPASKKKKKDFFDAKLTCDLLTKNVQHASYRINRLVEQTFELEEQLKIARLSVVILSIGFCLISFAMLLKG